METSAWSSFELAQMSEHLTPILLKTHCDMSSEIQVTFINFVINKLWHCIKIKTAPSLLPLMQTGI